MMLSEAEHQTAQVQTVANVQDLQRISERHVDAVLWYRAVPKNVRVWLGDVSSGTHRNGRFRLSARAVHKCVFEHFHVNGIAESSELDWFAGDIQKLTDELGGFFSTSDFRLRLEVIKNDACRKFHADNVKARLICTYAGPGTEYGVLTDGDVPNDIRRVPTGQPILLKGLMWPGSTTRQLKHRSPPIEGTGQTRFVVVLEPVTPCSEPLNDTYLPYP